MNINVSLKQWCQTPQHMWVRSEQSITICVHADWTMLLCQKHQTHPVCVRNRHQTHLRLSPGNCAVAWIRHASAYVLGIRVTSANTQTSIRDDTLDVLPPTVNIVIISSLFWVSRQPKRHAHLLQNMNISELRIYQIDGRYSAEIWLDEPCVMSSQYLK